jgi:hypothetical protein
MKIVSLALLSAATLSVPAFAGVNVSSPSNGESVTSPFTLSADAATCSSEPVAAMGWSLDNGSDLDIVKETAVDTKVSASLGTHILHIKSWGEKGALCMEEVKINVTDETDTGDDGSDTTPDSIPSAAKTISSIQTHSSWKSTHDSGTPGKSSGEMSVVNSPSHGGAARKFTTHFSKSGGQRYSDSFGEDTGAKHFVYDGWVYVAGSPSNLANMELDLNQVLSDGDVMIYSFQCSGYAGVWEFGSNSGSAKHSHAKWVKSNIACNPRSWKGNTWHHVQISYSRDDSGYITYKTIAFDGKLHNINKKVFGRFALHWAHVLQTNFQIDGIGSGSNTTYLDDLVVYRW